MQTHTNLEELLIDFLLTLDRHELLIEGLDIVKIATNYTSRNSLALGKPEPLAKNKKWILVCDHKWERVPKSLSLHCKRCGRYDHG